MSFVFGAQLKDTAHDPLPEAPTAQCKSDGDTGCVTLDALSGRPGFPLRIAGGGTYDQVFIDLRVQLALTGVFAQEGVLRGKIPTAAIESHVLACHLRGGADCSADEVARLEATHPRITVTGGTMRWRATGFYVTCPAFEDDPETYLQGVVPLDGGAADIKGASEGTFSTMIQSDLDQRGCATFGCHDAIQGPGKMHLAFRPGSLDAMRKNYQAVLPFITGDAPGGRFVNQVPLPAEMRARWLDWIGRGAPY